MLRLTNRDQLFVGIDKWMDHVTSLSNKVAQGLVAEVFDKAVSEANKSALEQFYQRDFMQKTQSTALEKLPTSIFKL